MFETSHKCLACGQKTITYRFAICSECEKEYGSSALEWPEWLRFLWRDTLRERREEKKHQEHDTILLDGAEPMAYSGWPPSQNVNDGW